MAGNNDAVRVAILRHLYAAHQPETAATDGGPTLDQLSAVLKRKGYKHPEVAINLDYLVAKGSVTEVVEHCRILTTSGMAERAEGKTYKISRLGIEQVQAEKSTGSAFLSFLKSTLPRVPIVILNLIAALVFFPFNILTGVPAAILICTSIVLGWFAFRTGRRLFLTASIASALAGIVWAAVGLFVVLQRPLYCYSSDATNPLKGEVLRIGEGKHLGNVFYIADPVRGSTIVRKIAQSLSRHIIFIEDREEKGQHAILIPMTDAVMHRVSSTGGARSAEELWVPYFGPTLQVETTINASKTVGVPFGVTYGAIMSYVQKANDRPGLPWQAVIYDPVEGRKSALYVSYLDVALSAAAHGDLETSIETLESSYEYAPSEVERARNLVLLANVSLALMSGTIGGTQSLSFMNEGMQHWAAAHHNEPVEKTNLSDPIEIWLYYEFRSTFFSLQAEYPNWAKLLTFHNSPVRNYEQHPLGNGLTFYNWTESIADSPEQSLISAENDQLMALVSATDDPDVLQRNLTERYGSYPDVRRWLAETMISETFSWGGFPPSKPLSRAIESAIRQMPEPWYSQYSKAWHMQQVLLRRVDLRNPIETAERGVQLARELGFKEYARVLGEALPQLSASVVRVNDTGVTPNDPWYRRNFLDWFAATALAAGARAVEVCKPAGPRCRELLESTADRVQRDRGGKGNLFAPGIALILTEARFAGQDLDPNWEVIYKEATGAEISPP